MAKKIKPKQTFVKVLMVIDEHEKVIASMHIVEPLTLEDDQGKAIDESNTSAEEIKSTAEEFLEQIEMAESNGWECADWGKIGE
jgi:Trp operon repressor